MTRHSLQRSILFSFTRSPGGSERWLSRPLLSLIRRSRMSAPGVPVARAKRRHQLGKLTLYVQPSPDTQCRPGGYSTEGWAPTLQGTLASVVMTRNAATENGSDDWLTPCDASERCVASAVASVPVPMMKVRPVRMTVDLRFVTMLMCMPGPSG
jgi:hypothetical protein